MTFVNHSREHIRFVSAPHEQLVLLRKVWGPDNRFAARALRDRIGGLGVRAMDVRLRQATCCS